MMLPSHLAATLILGFALARWFPFDARAWMLAIAFGVLIDIDHLFQAPQYLLSQIPQKGLAAFRPTDMLHYGAAWQGIFHHAVWGTLIVLAASLILRSPVPALFWGLHMFLDFVIARKYVVFGSAMEFAVLGGMLALVALLAWDNHRIHGSGQPIGTWARSGLGALIGAGLGVFRR